jgi:toxin YoeB
MSTQREAVCHPEFLEDLQHWIETDRRHASRILAAPLAACWS